MDGSRCATIDSFIAASFVDVDQLRDFEDGTLLDFILTRHTPAVAYTRTDIAAMSVTGEEALWLQVPSGTPVLHLTETYFDSARVPVLYSRNNFLTGPVAFHIERRPSR